MTLTRFQHIKRFIYVSDHKKDGAKDWFTSKISPFLDHFCLTSKRLWLPASKISADEMMVICHGCSAYTARMKHNPIGSGFKIWAMCDAGYIFYVFPHSKKYRWRECEKCEGLIPYSSASVATISDQLPCRNTWRNSLLMYEIYMDNFISSPRLFKYWPARDIGTVLSDASGFPKQLSMRGKKGLEGLLSMRKVLYDG